MRVSRLAKKSGGKAGNGSGMATAQGWLSAVCCKYMTTKPVPPEVTVATKDDVERYVPGTFMIACVATC